MVFVVMACMALGILFVEWSFVEQQLKETRDKQECQAYSVES